MPVNQKRDTLFYGWWVLFGCFFFSLYSGGALTYSFTAFLEPLAREFNWGYGQISIAASLRGLEFGILAPLLGVLVDRWGPRRLMLGGAILSGFCFILLSRINSLGMFYGIFFLLAIGMSPGGSTVQMTAVANWFHKKVALVIGIVASGHALGGLLVPTVTRCIDTFGWRAVLVVLGLGMWLINVPLALLVRHKPEQYGYLPDGDVSDTVAVRKGQPPVQNSDEERIALGLALRSRTFWHIALAYMCSVLVIGAVMTHVMPYLSSVDITRSISGWVAAILPVVSICGRLGFGWLGDKVNKKLAAVICFLLLTAAMIFFNYAAVGMWLLLPFLIFFGLGYGGNVSIRAALLRDYFGRSRLGTILGFSTGVMMLGNIAGAPLAGWAYDTSGSYRGAWFAFAAVAVVSAIIIVTTPPFKKTTRH
ncbi:MAG: MFS transporter [Deltaproteobacteria bacterium]|nr:MFS transporter [Deltaproteobacteria bacterium]